MKIILSLLFIFGLQAQAEECDIFVVKATDENERLVKFFDVQWKFLMDENPEWATFRGEPGRNDRWSKDSKEDIARQKRLNICQHTALKAFNAEKLSEANKLNLELALYQAELIARQDQFPREYLRISQLDGVHIYLTETMTAAPRFTIKDYEDRIARFEKFPKVLEQTQTLLNEGAEKQIILPQILFKSVPEQFAPLLEKNIEKNPLYKTFLELPDKFTLEQKQTIQANAKKVIAESVLPALAQYRDFLVKDYFPKGRKSIAWKDMPNGIKWYEANIKAHTTLDLTADELHQLGINEVARIDAAMAEIRRKLKFKGTKAQFHKFLLTSPQFYYKKPEELLAAYRSFGKQVDPQLMNLFGKLPRMPYGIRPIEAHRAKSAPAAFYDSGSEAGARAVYFELNTSLINTRPKWGMEYLFFHEAVPGHHLQIALSQEIEGAPKFRSSVNATAFVEGWGLYAESLGKELGFYKDLYSQYGQLGAEIWRAVRLVVDTGLHSKDWSRDKAINYFHEYVPSARSDAIVEVDRYINWPGQALAYKVGELKFKELRARAEKALGDQFNVREFHDEVLSRGAIPLPLLEKLTDQWIKNKMSLPKK